MAFPKIYGLRTRLFMYRARLIPNYLKHRYWEYLSKKLTKYYDIAPPTTKECIF